MEINEEREGNGSMTSAPYNKNKSSQRKKQRVREKDHDNKNTIDLLKDNVSKIRTNTFGWKVIKYRLRKSTPETEPKAKLIQTHTNRFKILEDEQEFELMQDNTVVGGIAQDIKNEELEKENKNLKNKLLAMHESYDAEVMSGQIMQKFLMQSAAYSLDEKNYQTEEDDKDKSYKIEDVCAKITQTLACQEFMKMKNVEAQQETTEKEVVSLKVKLETIKE